MLSVEPVRLVSGWWGTVLTSPPPELHFISLEVGLVFHHFDETLRGEAETRRSHASFKQGKSRTSITNTCQLSGCAFTVSDSAVQWCFGKLWNARCEFPCAALQVSWGFISHRGATLQRSAARRQGPTEQPQTSTHIWLSHHRRHFCTIKHTPAHSVHPHWMYIDMIYSPFSEDFCSSSSWTQQLCLDSGRLTLQLVFSRTCDGGSAPCWPGGRHPHMDRQGAATTRTQQGFTQLLRQWFLSSLPKDRTIENSLVHMVVYLTEIFSTMERKISKF